MSTHVLRGNSIPYLNINMSCSLFLNGFTTPFLMWLACLCFNLPSLLFSCLLSSLSSFFHHHHHISSSSSSLNHLVIISSAINSLCKPHAPVRLSYLNDSVTIKVSFLWLFDHSDFTWFLMHLISLNNYRTVFRILYSMNTPEDKNIMRNFTSPHDGVQYESMQYVPIGRTSASLKLHMFGILSLRIHMVIFV